MKYDVAISFAGEQREEAKTIAECLRKASIKVFYDRYEKATLWGKNLYSHLSNLYQNEAKYCIVLASKEYAQKTWTTLELQSAQARALKEKGREYILPVQFDKTFIPGVLGTIGYLDYHAEGPEGVCLALLEKIGRRIPLRRTGKKASRSQVPIILSLREKVGEWKDGPREDGTSIVDIIVSYEGSDKLLFDRIEIRHWPGRLLTIKTGKLISKAKYRFGFSYDAHKKYPLDPPLILNPDSESILRFQLEVTPMGFFPSTGGSTNAKLYYRTDKGQVGVLPLVRLEEEDYLPHYRDIYRKIRRLGWINFPVFEFRTLDKYEKFALTKTGAIMGKALKQLPSRAEQNAD
jgi:hypothetical protein